MRPGALPFITLCLPLACGGPSRADASRAREEGAGSGAIATAGDGRTTTPTSPRQGAPGASPRVVAGEGAGRSPPERDTAAATVPDDSWAGARDTQAAERVIRTYRRIRGLLASPADEDIEPSRAQRAALEELAGKDRVREAEQWVQEGVLWGDAAANLWFSRLVEDARANRASVVRFQMGPCVGWGSATPSDWTATSCFDPAVFFVEPTGDTTLVERCRACDGAPDVEDCRFERCSLVVEGSFTGEVRRMPAAERGGPGAPVAHVFRVQRARVGRGAAPMLALPGGAPPPDGPALVDGPPWGVLWTRAAASDPRAVEKAAEQVARLRAAGFPDARVVDSRRLPGLWCCSQAVLIGRFQHRAAARARARALAKRGFTGVIVRKLAAP